MNCNVPTDIVFSFTGFHHRGGNTDEHRDGWGIAFYEGRGCRLFIDTVPAAQSRIAQLVREYPMRSLNVIAHIRKATIGQITLENTHPFMREMWGRYWTFAHNGTVDGLPDDLAVPGRRYRPVGGTDSERAFCTMLETLRAQFPDGKPAPATLRDAIADVAARIAAHGAFNFLLSDGEALYAHASTSLAFVVRQAPFTRAHLVDEDYAVDFSTVTGPQDRVAVIATTPLTRDEAWTPIAPGTLVEFRDGAPVAHCPAVGAG
jgi:glutamine amidotransferase